jgi:AbrB family looped-hinge helix DNA binding protein
MVTASKGATAQFSLAKVTSKGQVTIPVQVRKSLGVKPGDKLRFEPQEGGFRLVRDVEENPFEKWRGIGGFPGMGKGREAIVAYFREMRGHDDLG